MSSKYVWSSVLFKVSVSLLIFLSGRSIQWCQWGKLPYYFHIAVDFSLKDLQELFYIMLLYWMHICLLGLHPLIDSIPPVLCDVLFLSLVMVCALRSILSNISITTPAFPPHLYERFFCPSLHFYAVWIFYSEVGLL